MEHYIPASLGNIAPVIEYELMKEIVKATNLWSKKSMTGSAMKRGMMLRLEDYEKEFNTYMTLNGIDDFSFNAYMTSNGIDDVSSMATLLPLDDFVECS